MPLLRPDVVKLDLRLVQDRPGPAIAEIMNAVNAYAERTGALLLAEGIETEEHLHDRPGARRAARPGLALRPPGPTPSARCRSAELVLPRPAAPRAPPSPPFACLPAEAVAAPVAQARC